VGWYKDVAGPEDNALIDSNQSRTEYETHAVGLKRQEGWGYNICWENVQVD
jgi:hypothetical protein